MGLSDSALAAAAHLLPGGNFYVAPTATGCEAGELSWQYPNTLETLVNLELGQAIVLGGVIARAEARTRAGLPGLSQIPILGALFGTHSRRFEESEALMFIVPSVVEAVPLQQRNRIQEAIRAYEEYRGGVDEVELLEQPRVQGVRVTTSTEDEDD